MKNVLDQLCYDLKNKQKKNISKRKRLVVDYIFELRILDFIYNTKNIPLVKPIAFTTD